MASSSSTATSVGNPYRLNAQVYESRLAENASRLFSTDAVRVIHCDGSYKADLGKEAAIREYLQSHDDFSGTRIIIIPQSYSWGELQISESGLRTLFAELSVFEEFYELVHAFGTKITPVDETYASRPMLQQDAAGSFQLCYLAKHVEPNDKEEGQKLDPYSVRQMAVYHSYNAPRKANTFILVNPSMTFQLHWLQAREQQLMNWTDMHMAVAYAMTCYWREYINFLEARFDRTQDKSLGGTGYQFALLGEGRQRSVTGLTVNSVDAEKRAAVVATPTAAPAAAALATATETPGSDQAVTFEDIQNLQCFKDRVLLLDHVLRLNTEVFRDLRGLLAVTPTPPPPTLTACPAAPGDEVSNIFSRYISETQVSSLRTEHLLKRIEGASVLLRTIIDFRALENARKDNEIMMGLSHQAREDNKIMVALSRMVTLLTIIYVPLTFAATLLSMGYISLPIKDGLPTVEFKSELWIFAFLTIILLTLTLGYKKFWDRREKKKEAIEREKQKSGEV